jgi:hypothetical protein
LNPVKAGAIAVDVRVLWQERTEEA